MIKEESIESFPPDCKLALYMYMNQGKTLHHNVEAKRMALGAVLFTILYHGVMMHESMASFRPDWLSVLGLYLKHENVQLQEYKDKRALLHVMKDTQTSKSEGTGKEMENN